MAKPEIQELKYPNVAALCASLATDIIAALQATLARGCEASLVVQGGRTPVPLFDLLASTPLDWQHVWITLGDERWVSPLSSASNEHLVREHLLQGRAAAARFVGLKDDAADASSVLTARWAALAAVPRPFDRLVLGMGDDGHIASLFPNSSGGAAALDVNQPPTCVATTAPVEPRARISLNLSALLQTRHIALMLVGDAKWATYQRARQDGPELEMPVRALLRQRGVPVSVYWAP